MEFKLLGTIGLPLQSQLQWVLASAGCGGFVVGDEKKAFGVSVENPSAPVALDAARGFKAGAQYPCNLPVPEAVYGEIVSEGWHGFRFLDRAGYDGAKDRDGKPVGDLLRTLVFGPDYGLYVLHPGSGMILSLRSGSMELLKRSAAGFEVVGQTRTRGKAALAFAGHPAEAIVAYGDNGGTFHAHRFDETGFGKASKIAAKERKASRVEFVSGGAVLAIGGMGYLATLLYAGGKFEAGHETSIAVRDFVWLDEGRLVLVNQGLHGVSAYSYGESGFTKLGEVKPVGGVSQMAVSKDGKNLAVTGQEGAGVSVYAIT